MPTAPGSSPGARVRTVAAASAMKPWMRSSVRSPRRFIRAADEPASGGAASPLSIPPGKPKCGVPELAILAVRIDLQHRASALAVRQDVHAPHERFEQGQAANDAHSPELFRTAGM